MGLILSSSKCPVAPWADTKLWFEECLFVGEIEQDKEATRSWEDPSPVYITGRGVTSSLWRTRSPSCWRLWYRTHTMRDPKRRKQIVVPPIAPPIMAPVGFLRTALWSLVCVWLLGAGELPDIMADSTDHWFCFQYLIELITYTLEMSNSRDRENPNSAFNTSSASSCPHGRSVAIAGPCQSGTYRWEPAVALSWMILNYSVLSAYICNKSPHPCSLRTWTFK